MPTISADVSAELDVKVTFDAQAAPAISSQSVPIVLSGYSHRGKLNASSNPPISGEPVDISTEIDSGGTADIDLTAVPKAYAISEDADLTGKKLVAIILHADPGNNASGVTIGPHPTDDPYPLWGAAEQSETLYPGAHLVKYLHHTAALANAHTAVGSGAKNIQIAGAAGDIIRGMLVFG